MKKEELLALAKKISEKKATPEETASYIAAVREELKELTKTFNEGSTGKK
jgi:hypothetical protein